MSEDRKELIHAIFRMISSGDLSRLHELVDPDYEEHGPFPTAPGIEGFRELIATFRAAFPDMELRAVDPIVEATGPPGESKGRARTWASSTASRRRASA